MLSGNPEETPAAAAMAAAPPMKLRRLIRRSCSANLLPLPPPDSHTLSRNFLLSNSSASGQGPIITRDADNDTAAAKVRA
jgi:hypothetical protein